MIVFDKHEIRESLSLEDIYGLLQEWGGDPEYAVFGILCSTICHNAPGEGSKKLYFYENTGLFKCYTGCANSTFDIFELVIKAMKIQKDLDWELYDAMVYVAEYFGLAEAERPDKTEEAQHWVVFKRHDFSLPELRAPATLKEYNKIILTRFTYPRILNWEAEGITDEVNKQNYIGYYAGGEQITIPHFDINNRLVGIRGRYLATEDAERYGKYRPLYINN